MVPCGMSPCGMAPCGMAAVGGHTWPVRQGEYALCSIPQLHPPPPPLNMQAFTNIVVSLLDEGDRVVLFAPWYFNHLMALQVSAITSWPQ